MDVPSFVEAFSAVVVVTLEDDPTACWVDALPPASDRVCHDRCVHLLGVLSRVHFDVLDPWRVCHIRTLPLFDTLKECTAADVDDMLYIAEYIQLPKSLSLRVQQHREAVTLRNVLQIAATTGEELPLLSGLVASAHLQPLLDDAATAANAMLAPRSFSVTHDFVRSPAFMSGLCGDARIPSPGRTPHESVADHMAGRVAAGHPLQPAPEKALASELPAVWAARLGRLPALKRLVAAGWCCRQLTCAAAAEGGHLEALQWLVLKARVNGARNTTYHAALGGALECLRWAVEHGCGMDAGVYVAAAKHGHAHVIRWLADEQRVPWSGDDVLACELTAARGDLELLQYLRDRGCPWTAGTCAAAAGAGHMHVLRWARATGCAWNNRATAAAAEGGHREVLQWLRAQDPPCPWDSRSCAAAAKGGHLTVLQWLRACTPPCPWDGSALTWALHQGHAAVAAWLRAAGCPESSGEG